MSKENAKNYTCSEDVYRNMSKERELLKRALVILEGSHYQDLVEEIRAYLEEPVVAESASTEPVGDPDKLDELVGSSKMEHTTEPVAFLYDLDAYCDHKPDENVLSKKLPKGLLARHIKNIRPLYTRPAPKREPLSDYDVCEEYITTIKEEPWTRIKAYFAGVRFAEEHHQITGGKDE